MPKLKIDLMHEIFGKGNEEQDMAKSEWYFDKFVEIINRE